MSIRILNRVKKSSEAGFTLIELLIVIVILGILAGIVVFAVGNARSDSVNASCEADKKTISVAAEAYKAKNKTYPTTLDDMVPLFLKERPDGGTDYSITYAAGKATNTCPA